MTRISAARSVLVTGAAHGIGKAIAQRLAREGWNVLAVDRNEAALKKIATGSLHAALADVASEADLQAVITQAISQFGGLHAIVSNAGLSEFKSLEESTLEDWNRILTTNLTPAFLLAKGAEKALREAKGAMILIASTRAHMSEPDTHAYSATKGGLVALTHSLAISLGPDVRVNCISPGWINVTGEPLSLEDHVQHPAGRVGEPEDIAAAVSFLLSDQSTFITGAELVIDGGMTRKMIYR